MPKLGCLFLKGNSFIRHVRDYRKNFIVRIASLKYLDDRPVKEVERLASEAFFSSGREGELAVRRRYA